MVEVRQRTAPVKPPKAPRAPKAPSRAIEVHGEEGYITVKRARLNVGKPIHEKEDYETVMVPSFTGPVARVKVMSSVTRNLGDYNSVKVEVGLDLPCYETDIEHTYNQAADWVSAKIESELEEGSSNG